MGSVSAFDSAVLLHSAVLLIIVLIICVVGILPYWMIFKKAGFAPALSLLMLIPLVNIVVLYVVAFANWKVVPVGQAGWPQYPPMPPPYLPPQQYPPYPPPPPPPQGPPQV